MSIKIYGYARVSSKEQNLDRQLEALKEYGIEDRDIITDKASGKDFNRQGYLMLKEQFYQGGIYQVSEWKLASAVCQGATKQKRTTSNARTDC